MDSPDYISAQTKRILSIREKYPFQPIIFAGSGLSRRWVKAPTWVELLEWAIGNCPDVDRPLHFFRQQEPELPKIATRISEIYQSWAWGAGRSLFPKILFDSALPRNIYLKHAISQHIKSFGVTIDPAYKAEANEFSTIRPHAVITTRVRTHKTA